MIKKARRLNLCHDERIPIFDYIFNTQLARNIASVNGGMTTSNMIKLIKSLNFDCYAENLPSLESLQMHIDNNECIILCVDHRVLHKHKDGQSLNISDLQGLSTDHAISVMGTVKDEYNNVVGLWINDTGGCSTVGPAFYCSKADYEIWRTAIDPCVLYVK
jgi:hypothetical protein